MYLTLPNSVELYYEKIGQGDPLLLLHGNGDSHQGLATLGKALTSDFTVYLIDSRGHGRSSHHGEKFVYEDLAQDIDYFIRKLYLEDVSIIGHSDGAIIATLLGIVQKDYLNKIILFGLTLKPDDIKEQWKTWIHEEYEKTKDPLFELMIHEPQIEYEDLKKIEVPALVVAAEDDVMELDKYRKIAETIPEGQLYIVENEDHVSYVLDTDIFAAPAKDFLV